MLSFIDIRQIHALIENKNKTQEKLFNVTFVSLFLIYFGTQSLGHQQKYLQVTDCNLQFIIRSSAS